LWYYIDPQGNTQGPFRLTSLFDWRGFFDEDFKVWRMGEIAEQAILVTDAFLMMNMQRALTAEPSIFTFHLDLEHLIRSSF
ncbi:hypothetical protein BAE44_0018864, partial [Dichanthelium oligosanthes]